MHKIKKVIYNVLYFFCCLLIWQGIVWVFHVHSYFLPSPWQVAQTLIDNKLLLWQSFWPTCLVTLIGLGLGAFWGALLAAIMLLFGPIKKALLPIILLSQSIPIFTVAPLFIIWLGYGWSAKIMITVLVLFFPVTLTFYEGLRRAPEMWLEVADLMQASRLQRFRLIELPAALPAFASGLKVAATWAPMGAVISEWVGANRGLGFLILQANARLDTPLMFAALSVLIMMSISLYKLVDKLTQVLIPLDRYQIS